MVFKRIELFEINRLIPLQRYYTLVTNELALLLNLTTIEKTEKRYFLFGLFSNFAKLKDKNKGS